MHRFAHKGLHQLLNHSLTTVVQESWAKTSNIVFPVDCIRVLSTRHVHNSPSGDSPAHSAGASPDQTNPNASKPRPTLVKNETFLQEVINEEVPPWEDEELLSVLMEKKKSSTRHSKSRRRLGHSSPLQPAARAWMNGDSNGHAPPLPFFSSPETPPSSATSKSEDEESTEQYITDATIQTSLGDADSGTIPTATETEPEQYSCKAVADAIFEAMKRRIGTKFELREVVERFKKNKEGRIEIDPQVAIPIANFILNETKMQSGKFVGFLKNNPWIFTLDLATEGPGLKKMIDNLDYMAISLRTAPTEWAGLSDLIDHMDGVGFKSFRAKTKIFNHNPQGYMYPDALLRDIISNFAFWVAKGATKQQTMQLILASRSLMESKEAVLMRYEWLSDTMGFELQDFIALPALLSLPFAELGTRFGFAMKSHWTVVRPSEDFPWAPEHLSGQFFKNWQSVPAEYRHMEDPIFKQQVIGNDDDSDNDASYYAEKKRGMHRKLSLPVPGCRHIRAEDLLHPTNWYEWVGKSSFNREHMPRHVKRWLQTDFAEWLTKSGHTFVEYRRASRDKEGYRSFSSHKGEEGYVGFHHRSGSGDHHVRPRSMFPYVFCDPFVDKKAKPRVVRDYEGEKATRERNLNDTIVLITEKNWAFDRAYKKALLLKSSSSEGEGEVREGEEEEDEGINSDRQVHVEY